MHRSANAGERLHEWMFGTRFWNAGGTAGVDDAFTERRRPLHATARTARSADESTTRTPTYQLLLSAAGATAQATEPRVDLGEPLLWAGDVRVVTA